MFCLAFFIPIQATASDLAPHVKLRGSWIQGGLIMGVAPSQSLIELNGKQLLQSPDGHFVFGFGRDESGPIQLKIQHNGDVWQREYAIEQRDYKIQKIEGIPAKIMNPDTQNQARSQAEARLVGQARQIQRFELDYLMGFQWPAKGPITGVYGSQRVYNGVPGRPHFGVDVAGPIGTPVYAPAPGVVTLVHDDMFYSGGTLIIDHGLGVSSTMIHLNKIHVKEGAILKAGDLIADMGASGRATGSHLDWRINWFDIRLDPQLLVP